MIIDRLIDAVKKLGNPTVVGLDTDFSYLPDNMRDGVADLVGAAEAVYKFNRGIIDAVCDIVPAVKVQVAYYEMLGFFGLQAFYKTCEYAKQRGMFVICDCKRNDIGSTAAAYSAAYLGTTSINGIEYNANVCDFLTVNAYLGADGIEPFLQDSIKYDKGIFVLVKTSNPSSGQLQDRIFDDGSTLYETMGNLVAAWGGVPGNSGYNRVGAVVGATHPEQARHLRKKLPHTFFLVPGYGAQGGQAEDVALCFDKDGGGAIVNSSRGILCAYRSKKYKNENYSAAARDAALDMRADLRRVL